MNYVNTYLLNPAIDTYNTYIAPQKDNIEEQADNNNKTDNSNCKIKTQTQQKTKHTKHTKQIQTVKQNKPKKKDTQQTTDEWNIISASRHKKKYKKGKIPKALREQVWIAKMGKYFNGACMISWCTNDISCFSFDCGHNIPESKGGPTNIENLIPICRNCNLGMSNKYTITEWEQKYETPPKWYQFWK